MVRRKHGVTGGERGSAAIEFALVLPLVLIMALALVQVGLLVKDQVVVAESARAGAREAAVTSDDSQVLEAATAAAVSLDTGELEVAVDREGGVGSAVTVTVIYHAAIEIPVVGWLFPEVVDITGVATMRQEEG